jgi:hypothetical protein
MNKAKISPEYQLACFCARLEITGFIRQRIKESLSNPVDWNKMIEVSLNQEILPLLYYNLDRQGLSNFIPQDINGVMKNYFYTNLRNNLIIEKEISFVLESANRQGLSIIPFRGFSLIQTLYPDPGLRVMVDVDILIKENDFDSIIEIFTRSGYQQNHQGSPGKLQSGRQSVAVFSKIHPSKPPLIIELHPWIAPPRPYPISLPRLWERAQGITLYGQKLLCLSQEDTFLSLALHLRRHTRRLTLKFLVDIAELLRINKNVLDWAYIARSAGINHIRTTVYFALYITDEMIGAQINPQVLKGFRPNSAKCALIGSIINKYNFFRIDKFRGTFLRFLLFDSPIDFILYLWRVVFLERLLNK